MKRILPFVLLLSAFHTNAQDSSYACVTGRVVSDIDGRTLEAVHVSIPFLKMNTVTNSAGIFQLENVKYGNCTLIIIDGFSTDTLKILVDGPVIDIGNVIFGQKQIDIAPTQNQAIILEDNSIDNEGNTGNRSFSGLLAASRDPYTSAIAFNFSSFRYQPRGYNSNNLEVQLNGLQMNDIGSGVVLAGQWGGLNDVFRNQQTCFGLKPGEHGFGGLAGSTNVDITALAQTKQTRLGYAFTNSIHKNRLMLAHSSGLMLNGWAYAFSFSKRWSEEGYVPGTFYNGYSFYAGVSRKLNSASSLHFTTFGARYKSGKPAPVTSEATDLAGSHFYNPNWGYQDGEKRNAKVNSAFQPVFIMNYNYAPTPRTKLNMALSYQVGFNGNSVLDWYNAQDPRPDYYKRLPSYYESDPQTADTGIANSYRLKWTGDEHYRQIDWNALYAANNLNYDAVNGVNGRRSVYMLGEDREDIKKYSFAATLKKKINEHINLTAGVTVINQQAGRYRKMLDLLGGDFYVNLNQFSEKNYPGNAAFSQNDLNNPDGIVKVNDKYSYDYKLRFTKAFAWNQLVYSGNKMDFFVAARVGSYAFQRDGLYKNGLFPDDSYGKSKRYSFSNFQLKGGLSYKMKRHGYLFVNIALSREPPTFDNTFISPRTRNTAAIPAVSQIKSIEGGYMVHSPKLTGRLSGFVTDINNSTEIRRFYHEDYNTFVNYVIHDVNVRHIGGEFALLAKLSRALSVTVVAAWTQVFYTSGSFINIYRDNDTTKNILQSKAYLKNLYVAAGPQSAYALKLNYNARTLGYATINFNYLNRNYLGVNPSRRTQEAVGLLPYGSAQWHNIVDQEMLGPVVTVDIFAGKAISLSRWIKWLPEGIFLHINAGVNNLLNNKNNATAGFEQLRFDSRNNNPERFPTKYIYGHGTNYIVNFALKF